MQKYHLHSRVVKKILTLFGFTFFTPCEESFKDTHIHEVQFLKAVVTHIHLKYLVRFGT